MPSEKEIIEKGTTFEMFSSTADESAYDVSSRILYVIGEGRSLLHVVDLSTPSNPTILRTIFFPSAEGRPHDVEVCGSVVAVSFSGQIIINDGHVRFYHPYTTADGLVEFHQSEAVGPNPEHIEFSPNCEFLVVASEGRPGSDFDTQEFRDPEGSVTQFRFAGVSPSITITKTVLDFTSFNSISLPATARFVWKGNAQVPMTLSQDLEPEHVEINAASTHAYIVCQKNNALITMTLGTGPTIVSIQGMGTQAWDFAPLDASSADGGVNRVTYSNIVSFRQPDHTGMMMIDGTEYILVANEGRTTSFDFAGVAFSDFKRGIDAHTDGDLATANANFDNLGNVVALGDLTISIEDGKNVQGNIEDTHFFGGRGISLHNPSSASSPVFSSGGSLEAIMDNAHNAVFNTIVDPVNTATTSPRSEADKASGMFGPTPEGIATGVYDATRNVAAVGSREAGIIFLFSQTGTSTELTIESSHRSGSTDSFYDVQYAANDSGDMFIADMGYVAGADTIDGIPLVYVVSSGSGSLALYQVIEV